jgi:endonuclease/exonuclease/phosphatase family metal-dependent hydrolase
MKTKLLLSVLMLLAIALRSQDIEPSKTTIKVLSLNILHGATTQGDFDLDVIAQLILDADPDFVAMQEVDFKTRRAKGYDIMTELGWRTKMAPIFGKAMAFDGGEYGEGILSKYSFSSSRNLPLPHSPNAEPRTALETRVGLNATDTIALVGTHFDHLPDGGDRRAQAAQINAYYKDTKLPTILAGDLNALPHSETLALLERFWTPAYRPKKAEPTYPSDKPTKKIDYVLFYPKNRWRVVATEVIQNRIVSDHCGYLVTLELLPK